MDSDLPPNAFPSRESFRFTGDGGEYFRIWIVNLLLSIVTLGIYSAWAKVRRLRYFYQHTEVAGSRFDYHGDPIAILKGRIVALILLVAYNFSFDISVEVGVVTLVVLAVVFPWLLRNSLRFRARYSSYRGLRFSFRGSVGQSYVTFLLFGALTALSLYILAPLFHHRLKRYQHGNAWFGSTPFRFDAGVGAFYRVYMITGLLSLAAAVVALLMFGGTLEGLAHLREADPRAISVMIGGAFVVLIAIGLLIGPLFSALINNLIWNHTRLGEHRFDSSLSPWKLMWIGLSNTVLVALTLGLFMPWAAVRLARYRAECLTLLPASNLDDTLAAAEQDIGAVGEESAEMFDFDIGL